MFCYRCGSKIPDNANNCPMCGTQVIFSKADDAPLKNRADISKPKRRKGLTREEAMEKGKRISDNIVLCEDGKYRWIYDMSLFKNPTVFLLIWKIFFFITLGIFVFMILLNVFEGQMSLKDLLGYLKAMGVALLILTALTVIGYLIYAAITGGRYTVCFEMDDKGINHAQVSSQAKKAKKLGMITAAAGAASGNIGTAGSGLLAQRTEMYTSFSSVRKIKVYRRRNLIKIREILNNNQIYASDEDFDFVLGYVLERIDEKAKPKKYRKSENIH